MYTVFTLHDYYMLHILRVKLLHLHQTLMLDIKKMQSEKKTAHLSK